MKSALPNRTKSSGVSIGPLSPPLKGRNNPPPILEKDGNSGSQTKPKFSTVIESKSNSIIENIKKKFKGEPTTKNPPEEPKRSLIGLALTGITEKSLSGTGAGTGAAAAGDISESPKIAPVTNANVSLSARESTKKTSTTIAPSASYLASTAFPCSKSSNIKVVVRFRPLNATETEFIQNKIGFITPEFIDANNVSIKTDEEESSSSGSPPFAYDRVFPLDANQVEVYDNVGREMILDVCKGYNGTIFTYGQSGSGKTYTMYGSDLYDETGKGIVPRAIEHLFEYINDQANEHIIFQLKFSTLQIYKEVIHDLLSGERDLKIKENAMRGIYVEKLSEVFIDSVDTFMELIEAGQEQRIVAETKLNHSSSRSHTLFILEVNQTDRETNITKKGTLYLVDLAGSEKIKKTGAVGETLEEAKKINLSLSALGNVIHALTTNCDFIPYRDSKLTRILQESLGGNYKTTLIVTCSPHSYHLEETTSSLKFAQRVKTIKNKVRLNIKLSYEELQKIIANLRVELEAANNQIICLNNLLKGKGNVEDNIIQLIETQNVKNIVNQEIQKSDNKILLAETAGNGSDVLCNAVPKNNLKNDETDLEKLAKKLKLMKRRNTSANLAYNIIMEKDKEDDSGKSKDSASDSSFDEKLSGRMEQMKKKLSLKDEEIKILQEKVKFLEEKCEYQEKILQDTNRDLYIKYQQLSEKVKSLLDERLSQTVLSFSSEKNLLAKVTSAIQKFENMINSLLTKMNLNTPYEGTTGHFNALQVLKETFSQQPSPTSIEDHAKMFINDLISCSNEYFTLPLTEIYNRQLVEQCTTLKNENFSMLNLIDGLMTLSQQMGERLCFEAYRFSQFSLDEKPAQGEIANALPNVISKFRCETFLSKKNVEVLKNVRRRCSRNLRDLVESSPIITPRASIVEDSNKNVIPVTPLGGSPNPLEIINAKRRASLLSGRDLDKCIREFSTLKDFVIKSYSQFNQFQVTFNEISKVLMIASDKLSSGSTKRVATRRDDNEKEEVNTNSALNNTYSYEQQNVVSNEKISKNVETMLMKFWRCGTASRKFDGIKFKLTPLHKLDLLFEGGINCETQIYAPVHEKPLKSSGDTTLPEASIIEGT